MHRLFVALRPPAAIREQLLSLAEGIAGLRWQDEGQIHLTLRFVGEVGRPVAEDLAAELARVRVQPFALALAGVGLFEKPRYGALWAGVQPRDQLKALHGKIERSCQLVGLEPERRTFHPHLTLARWTGRKPAVAGFLERQGDLVSAPWEVGEFILYESRLGRLGAHYEPVETYRLG